ncbi:hypothetical protein GC176_13765 [bacterium]|nr:hypothetical protein [bacterium]
MTGIPLVLPAGRTISEDFLLANCSDVAHSFSVHPHGMFGPPPPAWQELSDVFVNGKTTGLEDHLLAEQLRKTAEAHRAETSDRLLHSVAAAMPDGSLLFMAATGGLLRISRLLAHSFQATAALVLENSGSVGWSYREPEAHEEKLLVGAANQRELGTVFLAFDAGGYVDTFTHPFLKAI